MVVVTCGRTKSPPSKTIYIHRRRGGRIVSALCRSKADLVGDRPVISPTESPSRLLFPRTRASRFREKRARNSFWNSCRAPRVGAIGPNNYRGERGLYRRTTFAPRYRISIGLLSTSLPFSGGRENHETDRDEWRRIRSRFRTCSDRYYRLTN